MILLQVIICILFYKSLNQNIFEYFVAKSPSFIILSQNPIIFSSTEYLFCNFLFSQHKQCKNFETKGIFVTNPNFSIEKILIIYPSKFTHNKIPNFYTFDTIPLHTSVKNIAQNLSLDLTLEFNHNKDDQDDFVKNIGKHFESFELNDLISSVNEGSETGSETIDVDKSNKCPILNVDFFNAGEIDESDLSKFDSLDSKTLVIIAIESKLSKNEIIDKTARLYSGDNCKFLDSKLKCDSDITPNIESRLCNLNFDKNIVFDSITCVKKAFVDEINTRADVSNNIHNLNTYAEYTSDYPVIFTMCLFIAIMVIIISMALFMLLGGIDISQSVLQRDTITKLKNE